MKFAHLADCHLGAWRQPELQKLGAETFGKAIDKCIEEKVDFIIIAGDFFDIAMPSFDVLKTAAEKLRHLKENKINCYLVAGSHDFSATGKSIISVFEKAGLCIDLTDLESEILIKTNSGEQAMLFGIAGKKGGLEKEEFSKEYFQKLKQKINIIKQTNPDSTTIFVLHSTLKELIPESDKLESISFKELPETDYCALGHIHKKEIKQLGNTLCAYTGALFPTSFSELEQNFGSFFVIEKSDSPLTPENIKEIKINLKQTINFDFQADNENPSSLKEKIISELRKHDLKDKIVTIRISGTLESGKPSELEFEQIESEALDKGAFYILRNISKLYTKEFNLESELEKETRSISEIEQEIISESVEKDIINEEEKSIASLLLKTLDMEKDEDETITNFSSRLTKQISESLKLKL